MKLPAPPQTYDAHDQAHVRQELEKADVLNFKKNQNVEMTAGTKLILQSPNGTRYYLTASNIGVLTLTAV